MALEMFGTGTQAHLLVPVWSFYILGELSLKQHDKVLIYTRKCLTDNAVLNDLFAIPRVGKIQSVYILCMPTFELRLLEISAYSFSSIN